MRVVVGSSFKLFEGEFYILFFVSEIRGVFENACYIIFSTYLTEITMRRESTENRM